MHNPNRLNISVKLFDLYASWVLCEMTVFSFYFSFTNILWDDCVECYFSLTIILLNGCVECYFSLSIMNQIVDDLKRLALFFFVFFVTTEERRVGNIMSKKVLQCCELSVDSSFSIPYCKSLTYLKLLSKPK